MIQLVPFSREHRSRCRAFAVAPHLRAMLAASLILNNPSYLRHFLNGCYLLQDADSCPNSDPFLRRWKSPFVP